MICPDQEELLNQFIDGELDLSGQIGLFTHLAECSECRSFVDTAAHLRDIRRNEQITYPPEIDELVMSRLHHIGEAPQPQTGSGQFWKRKYAVSLPLAAACLVLTIFFGFLLGKIFVPQTEGNISPELTRSTAARPATVIMIYSVPPVEIVGNASLQKIVHHEQMNN